MKSARQTAASHFLGSEDGSHGKSPDRRGGGTVRWSPTASGVLGGASLGLGNSISRSPHNLSSFSLSPVKSEPSFHLSSRSLASAGSSLGWSGDSHSSKRRRPGSGRFEREELSCFKKQLEPSTLCSQKASMYWGSTGLLRSAMSEAGRHQLPNMKGEFFALSRTPLRIPCSGVKEEVVAPPSLTLPDEERTSQVLDLIYPRCPPSTLSREQRAGSEPVSPVKARATNRTHTVIPPALEAPTRKERPAAVIPFSAPKEEFQRGTAREAAKLLTFRQRLLDKFPSMRNAFDTFCLELGAYDKELNRKEFVRFLNKHFPGASKEEHERVFHFLDQDKNGSVSMMEFHTAVESAAPIKTLEDLRRRLIALGYGSMRRAFESMTEALPPKDVGKRLGLREFALCIERIGIKDEEEIATLFKSACVDCREGEDVLAGTISLDELASGLAAVSPALLLEDVRYRLLKKFGTLMRAYEQIDRDGSKSIDIMEFRIIAEHLKMTAHEADKCFRLIDVDGSGEISDKEFISALRLSEPALFLEDVRRKVRQRFQGIREAFVVDQREIDNYNEEQAELEMARMDSRIKDDWKKTPAEFLDVLAAASLSESDTQTLFDLVDINGDGKLNVIEFIRGIRIFAPSCMLEDLRLQCLRQHGGVPEAFTQVAGREKLLDKPGLTKVFSELGLVGEFSTVDPNAVFDLVESRRDGGVTVGEVMAALQSAAPGTREPSEKTQLDARARQHVRLQMLPFHRVASELRSSVRQRWANKERDLNNEDTMAMPILASGSAARRNAGDPPGSSGSMRGPQDRVAHEPTGQSYRKVSRLLRTLPNEEKRAIQNELRVYYRNAGNTIDDHEQVLTKPQSRFDQWERSCSHERNLEKPLL